MRKIFFAHFCDISPSNSFRQLFGPSPSFYAGVFCTHITCMKNSSRKLPGIRWKVIRIFRLASHTPRICDDLDFLSQNQFKHGQCIKKHTSASGRLCDQSAHRIYDNSRGTTVDTTTKGNEVSLSPRATKIVPKPTGRAQPISR